MLNKDGKFSHRMILKCISSRTIVFTGMKDIKMQRKLEKEKELYHKKWIHVIESRINHLTDQREGEAISSPSHEWVNINPK